MGLGNLPRVQERGSFDHLLRNGMDFSSFLAQEEENGEEIVEKDTMEDEPAVNSPELKLRKLTQIRTSSLHSNTQSVDPGISVLKDLPESIETQAEEEGLASPPRVDKEGRSSGSVESGVYTDYIASGSSWTTFIFMIFSNVLCQGLFVFSDIWLSLWTAEEEATLANSLGSNPPALVLPPPVLWPNMTTGTSQGNNSTLLHSHLGKHYFNLGIYGAIIGSVCVASIVRTVCFFNMCMRSSVKLHDNMFGSVIRAPCRFFDTNPVGESLQ